jgi:hypothetical protein
LGVFDRLRREWGTALVVTGAIVLALGGGVAIRGLGGLGIDVVVASVGAATALGRVAVAAPGLLRRRLWLLPALGVAAGVVGALMAGQHPLLGGAVFVLVAAAAAGARAVRSAWTATGLIASGPVLVALVAPSPVLDVAHVLGTAGAVTCGAACVLGATTLGARSGVLVAAERPSRPRPRSRTASHLRIARRTARAAVPALLALGAALAVGRAVFGGHWTWVVLTALVVGQPGAGHGDVLRRALLRLLGASVATVLTAPLVTLLPAHSALALPAIVGALVAGTWLRPLGYAYWAGSLTAVLALLQGYLDGPQPGFLVIRLGAIAVGGALAALIAAWPPSRNEVA